MDAKELMIGDLVYGLYPNGKRYASPCCISAVDTYPTNRSPRIVTAGGYGFQSEHLEPIPLTADILQKNGFIYNDLPFAQAWEGHGLSIYGMLGNYRVNCGIDVSMDVSSVHQLQHLFRLCGIKQEIII